MLALVVAWSPGVRDSTAYEAPIENAAKMPAARGRRWSRRTPWLSAGRAVNEDAEA
jgi:hypothetical protein